MVCLDHVASRPGSALPARAVRWRIGTLGMVAALMLGITGTVRGDLAESEALYKGGKYVECVDSCAKAIAEGEWGERGWILKTRAELTLGRYDEALNTAQGGLERYPASMTLWGLLHEAFQWNDRTDEAQAVLPTMQALVEREPWRYVDSANLVAMGRLLLESGADARQVLEQFYDRARREDPASASPLLASGELALRKYDYTVAMDSFREAARLAPDDPDAHLGLARSNDLDPQAAAESLARALELNPRHIESLLLQADSLITQEAYARAEELLRIVLEINPRHARAWAFRAVLAHLAGDRKAQVEARSRALATWSKNPDVDYQIGRKLSQDYRFAEAAEFQRRALAMDPRFGPAREQLCQDLLRLGRDQEGWSLAAAVLKDDPYNVMAYNLMTLHDVLAKFRTLESEHFVVRMEARESQVYGPRVMRLLDKAREQLTRKYDVELPERITIEIFPQQKDFAVRTFGMPGGDGFLGVCFGPLVTMNSPASRGANPTNWEAILWHEFCHSVTLAKTHNRMPRWLSEGISVYEERQALAAWGEKLVPPYRDLILEGRATPVSELSSAFLRPPSPLHLQFAYYQSSMVVEYVVQRFGEASLRNILSDLAVDVPINAALGRHTEPLERLDRSFAEWLRQRALEMAPGATWDRPQAALVADSAALAAWYAENPNNYWGLLAQGQMHLSQRQFEQAIAPLQKAIALYPQFADDDGPYSLLALAHRELADSHKEREVLERQMAFNADSMEGRLRLMELAAADEDWHVVRTQAQQALAVNPLVPAPHRYLARAAEALQERLLAIEAHRTLLLLDRFDMAEHHYRVARLLMEENQLPEARRAVLQALEEAPRFRLAHGLLLEIASRMDRAGGVHNAGAAASPTDTPASAGMERQ